MSFFAFKHVFGLICVFFGNFNKIGAQPEGSNYGIVYAESETNVKQNGAFCMMYNPRFHELPVTQKDAVTYPLLDYTPAVLCADVTPPPTFAAAAVGIQRGNCTFSEKALRVQEYGGTVALVVSEDELSEPVANSTADYDAINITVALVLQKDFVSMKALGGAVTVRLFAPGVTHVDASLAVIWAVAMVTVAVGASWAGHERHAHYMRRVARARSPAGASGALNTERGGEESDSVEVSPPLVVVFVCLMCVMLVLLYFFYDYLVLVIISLFCVAAAAALYACLKPAVLRMCGCMPWAVPLERLPLVRARVEVRRLALMAACLGLAVFWAVERNASYGWLLQDFLGVAFCINVLKTVRLPSLKICALLLILLFVYDIFFVFLSPLITGGDSIMVKVATGGGSHSHETLPMVLKVPRLFPTALSVCAMPFSLLGFGDILVPGLLLAYCRGYDLVVGTRGIYFIVSLVAYGVGLLLTFLALALMASGQPALLYIVPCTLLSVVATGVARGELRRLWRGAMRSEQDSDKIATPDIGRGQPDVVDHVTRVSQSEAASENEAGGEVSEDEGHALLS